MHGRCFDAPRQRSCWCSTRTPTPEAGTQIPAGCAQEHESLAQAVLREIAEETGLQDVALRGPLHTEHWLHPVTGDPRTTTLFAADTTAKTPQQWSHTVAVDGRDADMVFRCRFTPLPLQQRLVGDQDAWLGLIDPGFKTITRR